MTKKKATKKTVNRRSSKPQRTSAKFTSGELKIQYSNSHDLLEKLFNLTQSVSRLHSHALLAGGVGLHAAPEDYATATSQDVLGPSAAYDIVTGCAGETDISKKLSDVPGLDPAIFHDCVKTKIEAAGYVPGDIPASPSTTLWEVIVAIQGCPKAP